MNFRRKAKLDPVKVQVPINHKESARLRAYLFLVVADCLAIALSFLVANYLYLETFGSDHGITMLTLIVPIHFAIGAFNGAYSGQALESSWHSASRSLQAFFYAAGCVLFIAYLLKAGADFSRAVFGIGTICALISIAVTRLATRPLLRQILGGAPFSTAVIRDGVPYEAEPGDIVLTPEQIDFDPETSDPIAYHLFAQIVAHADRVLVACPIERYPSWSSVLKSMAVSGEIIDENRDSLGIIGIGHHGKNRTMVVSAGPLHLRDRALKRTFDIAASVVAGMLLLPLFVIVAIAIKLESKGPVFFVQARIGQDNKIFQMFKFRSMFTDQCDANAAMLTTRNDSRVTRVGEFIRRTSIDELPQLLNVLNGTMSIVGPRPHAMSAKAGNLLYWDIDPRYRHRHSMKPGLTGLAQIRGFRGATDRTEDLTNRLMSDLEYASTWSLSRDLWIIFRTVLVLRHDNAF